MAPRRIAPHDLAGVLPPGGLTLVQGCATESALLADGLAEAGDALGAMTIAGVFIPGLNKRTYLAGAQTRTRTFFMTPELKAADPARVDFRPLCYTDILHHLRTARIDAALFMVSPPDARGVCSFGPTVDFIAELWPRIPVRIAHVNPRVHRTQGPTGVPWDSLTAVVEADAPLLDAAETPDALSRTIAANVAAFVEDGATLQTGIGKAPGAILAALADRRGLRIHSGLIGDAVLDLEAAGALDPDCPVTTGVAIGGARLYEAVASPRYVFHPVSHTHAPLAMAGLPGFVAINSAFEVDLWGQAYAEVGPRGWASGPGGATDFARGARLAGGLRIVALPASAGESSRIVAPGRGRGPVSLARTDIDIVVTEHGSADLRGLGHEARAAALVEIAAPAHRETLAKAWRDGTPRG